MTMLAFHGFISRIVNPRGKYAFIHSVPRNALMLDVGCGNNSPARVKAIRKDIDYRGLDVTGSDMCLSRSVQDEKIILCEPDRFHEPMDAYPDFFDAIISSHNLEHCNDYLKVTSAMIGALKPGGRMYISFPCEASAAFPSRAGCLNFYDDPSHRNLIPFEAFIKFLEGHGMKILYASKRHRPVVMFLAGLLSEPFSRLANRQFMGGATWAFFGFESVILAEKS